MKQKIVESYIRFYNNFEIEKMLELFIEDCIFENINNSSGMIKTQNKKDLQVLMFQGGSLFSYRQQIVRNWIISDSKIAIEIDYHAIVAHDFGMFKAGQNIELKGVSVFEFSDDKIQRLADFS